MHPIIRSIQVAQLKNVPTIRPGYTVRVSQKIKEGAKERIQKFEGLVIQVSHGEGVEKTFTVRKIVEGIGVEKIFPFHSPNVTEILVVKIANVGRAKLYYMRDRFGKSARLLERQVGDEERAKEMEASSELLEKMQSKGTKKKAVEEESPAHEEVATESSEQTTEEKGVGPAMEKASEATPAEVSESEKKEESA